MKRAVMSLAGALLLSVAVMTGPAQAQTKTGSVACGQTQRCEVTTYTYPGGDWTDHDWYHNGNRVGGDFWWADGFHTSASGMASVALYEVTSDYLIDVRATDCIPKPVL